ncbi:hypothetical protein QQY79_04360 [Flavobacterium tructae]|uniref:hypothetical protein n=1 Tax=Flavobacterium tructae TaxID=1114873 RepID=UPI00255200C7|nr:hypothetical protein [Flavobacterium tructae]MDL2141742.1 hypothetical protein [Flavobacterium tructae]
MNIFKIILDPILGDLRDKTLEALYDESIRIMEKEQMEIDLQWEKKLLTLHGHLYYYIANNAEIPANIKKEYPFHVADYCVKANKEHLVKDLLADYYKRLKTIKRRNSIVYIVNGIFKVIEYAIIGVCIFAILLVLYSLVFGKPDFMYFM